jgi:hypothetical protein
VTEVVRMLRGKGNAEITNRNKQIRRHFNESIYLKGAGSTLLRNVGKHLQDLDRATSQKTVIIARNLQVY